MAANGAPILLARLLRGRTLPPVDFGLKLRDGRPLFGHSKTWPGIGVALLAATVVGLLLGHPWYVGASAGLAAMVGDLFSSFVKRRLGIPPSGRAVLLDQLPESLLPTLVLLYWLPLNVAEAGVAVLLFFCLGLPLSWLLFQLGIRKQPY
ncbi:MAG: CDP-archaeol synthase [Xanthomonadaceae bacterium]|nr:CDP-archaeol synthase [Xanthomonadaceae bacterium]